MPELDPPDLILLVTDEAEAPIAGERIAGEKGWGEEVLQPIQRRVAGLKEVRLPVVQLEQNMNQFLQLIGRLFKQVDQQMGAEAAMKLDEIELSVEIGAEGEVKLVAGGKATGKGAIKLKFTRADVKQ